MSAYAVNSILQDTEVGVYYSGPLEPAKRALLDSYGEDNITVVHLTDYATGEPYVQVTEHRGGAQDSPNQWGSAETEDEAWRYLIGADFGPLDDTYDDEGYEEHQRRMLGLDPLAPTTTAQEG